MRLLELELLAYGPFRGAVLDFSEPGLHVVFGRNEAGKSTSLRAITGLLYGIDRNTPDAHLHKTTDLRIGGLLEGSDGARVRVVRRKGVSNTLLDDAGRPIHEATLKQLLGGVSQESFRQAFGLDHDTLEAGAKALLEGKGDLGESLFDASVGGGGEVQRLLAALGEETDAIYRPRATSLPLNEALKSFAEAQRRVREKQSLPEAFLEQERGLAEATREREACAADRDALAARRQRLDRARRRLPSERRRERALERRAALGPVTSQVARVEALKGRFVAYERALEQRRAHLVETDRLGDRIAVAAQRVGLEEAAAGAALRLEARTEARVHALLQKRSTLAERCELAAVEIHRLERERERQKATPEEIAALARARELAPVLERSLARARDLGDVEARLEAERARLARTTSQLEERAASLGGALEALVGARLPASETALSLASRAVEVDRERAQIADRLKTLEREAAALDRQIATHAGDFAPPDVAALRSARAARDEAWRGLRATDDKDARRAAEVELEGFLREADAVADRMIREADRVTSLARLRSEAAENLRQREKAAEDRARAEATAVALRVELEALFPDPSARPGGFAEISPWLAGHRQIVDEHAALREARAEHAAREDEALRVKADLVGALTSSSEHAKGRFADLVAGVARASSRVEVALRDASEREKKLVEIERGLDDRASGRERDAAALADVGGKLAEILAPLGIPVDASAEEVSRSIEAMRELFALVDARAGEESRARIAEGDVASFETDLGRAISDLTPDLAAIPPREAAAQLFARGAEAREAARELAEADAQLEAAGDVALDDADRALLADPDAASRIDAELADAIDERDGDVTRLTERIGGIRRGLEEMRADSHAAQAAAEAQESLARVRALAERWARTRLASVILGREIERYREQNQGPLLAASSALFARLTLGAFSGIKAGFDDKDRPALRCVRAVGEALGNEVDVVGLSDGTRDQLYLSLRLASLLRRAEVEPPMPLVLDDVLIQLDDQRASAALGVLAEVSQRMQVLFFTHHARLVDLARAAVPAGALHVHELGPRSKQEDAIVATTS